MKLINVFVLFFLLCMTTLVRAQDEPSFTDEDIHKYAVTMDSIEHMTENFRVLITEMVQGTEVLTASRYNDLSKIVDDSLKLAEAEATEAEITFVKEVATKRAEETKKINETFQSLAKDYIGAKAYNEIKSALSSDPEVKAKYDAELDMLKEEEETMQE